MTPRTRLRYVDASHVETSARDLEGFDVITAAGKRLGEFDGLIVDPPERRIRYLVVHRASLFGRRRVLVPMSTARLDLDHRALEVELESGADCPAVDVQEFAPMSDDDLLAAMFQRSTSFDRNSEA
jgi:sporulation protein YlmC with PRC-barrel domain